MREDEGGNEIGVVRIDNDPAGRAAAMADPGTPRWPSKRPLAGRAVDVMEGLGADVGLVNPCGLQWGDRRVKND